MVRLPTRRELAAKLDKLERDLIIATAGAGVGATLARSPSARSAALTGLATVSPYALAIDALVRAEESLAYRAGETAFTGIESLATGIERRARTEGLSITGPPPLVIRKRTKSKFNKAVSAGMKAVKASTSYGKKGKITNAKKAFAAVTKVASAISKGKKLAKTGIRRIIGRAIKPIYKRPTLSQGGR